jgi:hypothetical protein
LDEKCESLILIRNKEKKLNGKIGTCATSLKTANICITSMAHVLPLANNTPSNIVFRCAAHYIDCWIKELGIDNLLGNLTYTTTPLTNKEILDSLVFLWIIQQR